jgi:hypothetical protein
VVLLGTTVLLISEGGVYALVGLGQAALALLALAGRLGLPVPGAALAYYYVLVSWSTIASLADYLRSGVPPVWDKAEGTR